eukprot:Pompholyxophrys_punicea_v1_NODE_532_length_1739_cov_16.144893.p1 type:complete len:134 gc:universal NODE_532_length_1739_cov_16.144893:599-198(-)
MFHAFTGCDRVSMFYGKGKKKYHFWDTWKVFPDVTEAFLLQSESVTQILLDSRVFALLERFVVLAYDKESDSNSVDDTHQKLFCKEKSRFGSNSANRSCLISARSKSSISGNYLDQELGTRTKICPRRKDGPG